MQRNRIVKGLLGGLLVMAMLLSVVPTLVFPATTAAATWFVDPSGVMGFTTIQAAVTAASGGDDILVLDGTYAENVIVDKSLVIRSASSAAGVTVTAVTASSPVFIVSANSVTIDGFTVSGTTSTSIGGIEVSDVSSCLIANNYVTGCGVGIRLAGGASNNSITGNNCYGNTKYGLAIRGMAAENLVSKNIFSSNTSKDICIKDTTSNNRVWLNDILSTGVEILTTVVGNSPSPITYTYNSGTYTGYLGNYYSTYSGVDADGNGVGDSAFTSSSYTDSYPLMAEYDSGSYVEVVPPVAAFGSDVQSGTAPLTVAFTDQSTGAPTSWAWDFDNDGSVDSTDQNPSYIYAAAGTHTVKLTAANAAGSDDEVKTDYITVTESVGTMVSIPLDYTTYVMSIDPDYAYYEDSTEVGVVSSPPDYSGNMRGYVYADLSLIPAGATVSAANLRMCLGYGAESGFNDVHRVNDSWELTTLTWNNQPSLQLSPTDSQPTSASQVGDWISWSITADVQACMSGVPNCGWVIKYSTEDSATALESWYFGLGTDYPPYLEVTYTAAPGTYVITASAGANGSIDPAGAVSVNEGDSQSFTITQDTGYEVADVLVDGASVGAVSSYTFTSVQADHTIAASFKVAPWIYFANPSALPGVGFGFNLYDFTPNASGVVWFDADGDGIRDAEESQLTVTVNATGSYGGGPLTSPADAAPGPYTVYADVPEGGAVEALAIFTVRGIILSPASGPSGTIIDITGLGFATNRTGTVWFDSDGDSAIDAEEPQVAATTDSGGTLSPVSLTVPDVAGGTYYVRADVPAGGFVPDVSAAFTVTSSVPEWDLNGDGVCNIGDVVVIGLHWGETGPAGWIPQDLNSDGVINIGDVVVLGLHWGETW